MSVMPLSFAINDGLAPNPDREPDAERPGQFNDEAFSKSFDAGWDKAESEAPAKSSGKKSLDELLDENLSKHQVEVDDSDSFEAAREARREINERYGKQGDLSKTLDQFLRWAAALKRDPTGAAQEMAAAYAQASPWSLKDKKTAKDSGDKLDAILSDAIDNASGDKHDFQATAKQRAALKQVFPGLSYGEALKKVVQIDREMIQDPLGTAGALAAAYGMPVTPKQAQEQQRTNALGQAIDQALPTMPGFNPNAAMAVLNHPEFKRTNDPVADLQRAHAVTQRTAQYMQNLGNTASARLAQPPPHVAREVENVILRDPTFKKMGLEGSPFQFNGEARLEQAIGIAQERLARNVSRAKRAAPVKSSGTQRESGALSDKGLDKYIDRALSNFGF